MYAVRPVHPVQEEQTVSVVDLVLQGNRLETIGRHVHPLTGHRQLPPNNQSPSPGNVTREVGDRHTALATTFLASRTHDHGVAQNERTVTRTGLDMSGDIQAEHPRGDSDLLSSKSYATRRSRLSSKQIGSQLDHRSTGRIDVAAGH